MTTEIREITPENRNTVLALRVGHGQEGFVETVEQCLRDAEECQHYHPVAIYVDGAPVGFAMYGYFPKEGGGRVWMDRLLIDARFQGRGYGRSALEQLLEFLTDRFGCEEIYLSIYPENTRALKLYREYGFEFNGELDFHGEQVMVRRKRKTDDFALEEVCAGNLYRYDAFHELFETELSQYQSRIVPRENAEAVRWYFIVCGGVDVGSVWLEKPAGAAGASPSASLGIFLAAQECRGQGLGGAVIREVIRRDAEKLGVREILLNVREDNPRARACYSAVGFRETGRYLAANGVPAIHMSLEL